MICVSIGLLCGSLSAEVFWARPFTLGADFDAKSGNWSAATTSSAEGFLGLNAANTSPGEAVIELGQPTDLTSKWNELHLVVSLRLGQTNSATGFRIGFESQNGGRMLWDVPLADFSKGRFKTHLRPVLDTPALHDPSFQQNDVRRVILVAVPQAGTQLDCHVERVALADVPAQGALRIAGPAHPSDPPGATYYPTIQAAVDASRPRDVVLVQPGVYQESVRLTKDYASHETRLILMASKRGPVVLSGGAGLNAQGNYTGLEYGFDWSAYNQPAIRANHIEIAGFIVRDYVGMGMGNRGPGQITIRQCVLHSNGGAGIGMNFPMPDTRLRIHNSLTFLNGWGEAWASGIHLNNKDVRLNSITRDAAGNSLPEDDDHGHEVIGNLSFLNLDESQYNSDGNGIMIDFGGGSEARVTDNLLFLNAGAGFRNLNGRVHFERNLVYRNGWDHRGTATADPTTTRSPNEQVGFLLRHNTSVFPGTLQEFLDFNHREFIRSRLVNNLIWTASRFNFDGPYFAYTTSENQNRSLSQFALEAGVWSLFRGDNPAPETSPATGHVARQAANGHKFAGPGGNLVTDDDYLLPNPQNPAQLLRPQLRQNDLHNFFEPNDHPFESLPGPGYVPPAYAHIYGQALRDANENILPLSENTSSIGMVWNSSTKKNISSKHQQVANPGSRPPLDLGAFDFRTRDDAAPAFLATSPQITFDPAYEQIFRDYLSQEFPPHQPLERMPYDWTPQAYQTTDPCRPVLHSASDLNWLQAEDVYESATHNSSALHPRWQLVMHDDSRFGTPYLHANTVFTLDQLNLATALRFPFQLDQSSAPLIVVVLQTPVMPNANNDSFFIRVSDAAGQNPLALPLDAVRQNPAPNDPAKPRLTDTSMDGWHRFFVDHTIRDVMVASLQLPKLAAGNYEIQIQPRQGDVFLDRIGVFTGEGEPDGHHATDAPGPRFVFADWMRAKLPPSQSSRPEYQDPVGDPLGIGRPNLLAYALDILPTNPNARLPVTIEFVEIGDDEYLALRMLRPPGRTDLEYHAEVSSDLVTWNSGPSETELVESLLQSEGWRDELIRDRTAVEKSTRRFMRLRVKRK